MNVKKKIKIINRSQGAFTDKKTIYRHSGEGRNPDPQPAEEESHV
jgi:hypothetical protein